MTPGRSVARALIYEDIPPSQCRFNISLLMAPQGQVPSRHHFVFKASDVAALDFVGYRG